MTQLLCCYFKKVWKAIAALEANAPIVYVQGDGITITGNSIAVAGNVARKTLTLAQFAATTSLELKTLISDETGSGALVFATSPALVTPDIGTPSAGNLSNTTADGTNKVGTNNIPFTTHDSAYPIVKADEGHGIRHSAADATARIWTIGANSVQAWSNGAVIHFRNNIGAGVVTISVTTDTLQLAGTATTGDRTLAAGGLATAVWDSVSSTWMISGAGLT